jgi:hypothetical protein
MANEIAIRAALAFIKSGDQDGLDFGPATFTFTGTRSLKGRQSVGTSEEALILGEVTAGGWLLILNKDATNFVSLRAAAGATPLAKIGPGECALLRLHPSAPAPTVQADTAACQIRYLILEA